jgi:DNA-binding FadR family transcriptional regulator
MRLWYVHAGTPSNSRDDHQQLLQILRYGYPRHAEEVMRAHVLETAEQIIPHLESIEESAAP